MWQRLAHFILKHRWWILLFVIAITIFFGWYGALRFQVTQEYLSIIPKTDPDVIDYHNFKKQFGEEGNTVLIAIEDQNWFQKDKLNELKVICDSVLKLDGVKNLLNVTQISQTLVDESQSQFVLRPFMPSEFKTDSEVVALKKIIDNQPFYHGLLFNDNKNVLITAVSFTGEAMDTKRKHSLFKEIESIFNPFAKKYNQKIHYAGVPYIRTYMTSRLPKELGLFVLLSLGFTAGALFLLFRSLYSMVFPIILLAIGAISSVGFLGIFDFKVTILMGMLPAIIIILGIPPCIYMLTDYLAEYKIHKDKSIALGKMLEKLGLVTFMINANTAFGFLTLYFTDIKPLREFGLIAFISTMWVYLLTIFLIPGVFSLLSPPTEKNIRAIKSPLSDKIVSYFDHLIIKKSNLIYLLTILVLVVSLLGMSRLKAISFMKDDLPTHDNIIKDLNYMESEFKGALPFEIVIDFQKKGAAKKLRNLTKLDELQDSLKSISNLSRTLSIVDAMKLSRQALYENDPEAYSLPASNEIDIIASYLQHTQARRDSLSGSDKNPILSNLVNPEFSKVRITGYMKDIGSKETPELIKKVENQVHEIFKDQKPEIKLVITGTTRIFLKTNDYLIDNLVWSLLATFLIIGLQMWVLFGSLKIMFISLITNIIPLIVVAGVMGFLNITLKPSTALIYELAFGIAIDSSIHYLTAYRIFRKKGVTKVISVSDTGKETGVNIILTTGILFLGFGVFIFSSFGSTRSLGILTSTTLLISLFTNLLFMPVLIKHFDSGKKIKDKALIDSSV